MRSALYRHMLKFRAGNLFKNVEFRQARHDLIMSLPQATPRYAMFFTPRSGSSRVTDLAMASGVLGRPDECFNPQFVPTMAQALSARNLAEYIELLGHRPNAPGAFGCQITFAQMVAVFGSADTFLDMVRPHSVVWLIRKDIVAQAVSVSRMVQTGVSHAPQATAEALIRAENEFVYRPRQIRNFLWRIRWMEKETEAMIARHPLRPLRLSYEGLSKMPTRQMLDRIAAHVGAAPIPECDYESSHKKLAGRRTAAIADRFRVEHPRLLARLEEERDGLLTALNDT